MAIRLPGSGTPTQVRNDIASSPLSTEDQQRAEELFDQLCSANSLKNILSIFQKFCECVKLRPSDYRTFYPRLREVMSFSWKWKNFQSKIDKREAQKEYGHGKPCSGNKVMIIGAGPCGLRAAIECALLGAKVVVIEKRDRFSRNNVLHLWPFVIVDLRNLGAKRFYPRFCGGSVDHISIRTLQCILLKVCLLLGVEIQYGVSFVDCIEPPVSDDDCSGWRARLLPAHHELSCFEFDVLIGADGRRSSVPGFQRKVFRGKLAIAITANFINRNTIAEQNVAEISGVARIYNQQFFQRLYETTGIDLENIVYYKDATHYFVMTAKKSSLLTKGVLKADFTESESLLDRMNIDRESLAQYALEAAKFATENQLPSLEFAIDAHGDPDVSVFDFTNMYASDNAARIIERRNHRLLVCLVGDSLIEPFWPLGTGCAHGFLGVFDAAWMVRHWGLGHRTPLQLLVEREALYRILPSVKSESLNKNSMTYSIDPSSRYPHVDFSKTKVANVRHLLDTDTSAIDETELTISKRLAATGSTPKRARRETISEAVIISWLNEQLGSYGMEVNSLYGCVNRHSAHKFAALIHRFRPELIDFDAVKDVEAEKLWEKVVLVLEKQLGLPVPFTVDQVLNSPKNIGFETVLGFVGQIYEVFRRDKPGKFVPSISMDTSPLEHNKPRPNQRSKPSSALSKSTTSSSRKRHNADIEAPKRHKPACKRRESLQQANVNLTEKIKFLENVFNPQTKSTQSGMDRDGQNFTREQIEEVRKELRENGMSGLHDKFPANLIKLAVFHDKKHEMNSKLSDDAKPEAHEVDEKLQNCDATLQAGVMRGVRQVTDFEKDFNVTVLQHQEQIQKAKKPPAVQAPAVVQINSAGQLCHFCGKQVYLAERKSVEGVFFHRTCFKCHYCGKVLSLTGDFSYDRYDPSGGKFYCASHYQFRKHDLSLLVTQNPEPPIITPTSPPTFRFERYPSRDDVLRSPTPNRLLDEDNDEVERTVLDDDTFLTHNFGMVSQTGVKEDISSTTDSESEVYEELSNQDDFEDPEDAVERWRLRRLSSGNKHKTSDNGAAGSVENNSVVLTNSFSSAESPGSSSWTDSSSDDNNSEEYVEAKSTVPQSSSRVESPPERHLVAVEQHNVNGATYFVQELSDGRQRITINEPTVEPRDYRSPPLLNNNAISSYSTPPEQSAIKDDVFMTPKTSLAPRGCSNFNWDDSLREATQKLREFRFSLSRSPKPSTPPTKDEEIFFTPQTSVPVSVVPEIRSIDSPADEDWPKRKLSFDDGWTVTVPNDAVCAEAPERKLDKEALRAQVLSMTAERRAAAREKARLKSDAELGFSPVPSRGRSSENASSSSSDSGEFPDSHVKSFTAKNIAGDSLKDPNGEDASFSSGFLKKVTQVAQKHQKDEATKLLHRAQEVQRLIEETEARIAELDDDFHRSTAGTRQNLDDRQSERSKAMEQLAELKLIAESLRLEDRLRICQEELRVLMGAYSSELSSSAFELSPKAAARNERVVLDEMLEIRRLRAKVDAELRTRQQAVQ